MTGKPMCQSWYENAGGYRPWHSHQDASCTCGLNVHYPDSAHNLNCPVRENYELRKLTAGEPER